MVLIFKFMEIYMVLFTVIYKNVRVMYLLLAFEMYVLLRKFWYRMNIFSVWIEYVVPYIPIPTFCWKIRTRMTFARCIYYWQLKDVWLRKYLYRMNIIQYRYKICLTLNCIYQYQHFVWKFARAIHLHRYTFIH